MRISTVLLAAASIGSLATLAAPSPAQCLDWNSGYELAVGANAAVTAFCEFDDGSGPALYVGGGFTAIGGTSANRIAKWDGTSWSAMGSGMGNGAVWALAEFDDGTGSTLFAAGTFTIAGGGGANRIAKWTGSDWSALAAGGLSGNVTALALFDDGSGPALFAGGNFTFAGGVSANRVAKWDGSTWTALSSGLSSEVSDLAVFDDGDGPALYAGGAFSGIAPAPRYVAKWNGSTWSRLASNVDARVWGLAVADLGAGPRLYAGGNFTTAGGAGANRVAAWDGTSWSPLGSGIEGLLSEGSTLPASVTGFTVFDDGSGAALFAHGGFTIAGGTSTHSVAKWDGANWSPLGSAPDGVQTSASVLLGFDDGSGPLLFVGGSFTTAGGLVANGIAKWNGSAWSTFPAVANGAGLTQDVRDMEVFDDGSGPALFAAGALTGGGTTSANCVAKWDGTTWSALGGGTNSVIQALAEFDDGSGPALYAAGYFTLAGGVPANRIAKWDGSSWSALGSGMDSVVTALCVYDDGGGAALYAGGGFATAGGVAASRIAKWDGSSWTPVGAGVAHPSLFPSVSALRVFDDGSGPVLVAGGFFETAGGVSARNVAKWDGATWSALGSDMFSVIYALAVFDDGSGPTLFAGTFVTSTSGLGSYGVLAWDGSNWSGVGGGATEWQRYVVALGVFDDGDGAALYAGGDFTSIGGASANRVAKWDGSSWSALGSGIDGGGASSFCVFDDGADGAHDLYVGGSFTSAGGKPSARIAQWLGCEPGTAYCFGDGIDSVVTALCPCGNVGDPGRGCANSNAALGGARLFASGSTSPNTILFTCTGVPNNNLCTFLRGTLDDASGAVFGDGVKCASGTVLRFGQQTAGQGGNPSNTVVAPPGSVAAGNTRYYQVHYRNPNAGFCPPALFNISNAYRLSW